jgi:hypothetical protein
VNGERGRGRWGSGVYAGPGRSSTRRLGAKGELQLPIIVVDPILGLHIVGVDVCEPADAGFLEVGALRVEQVVVRLQGYKRVSAGVGAVDGGRWGLPALVRRRQRREGC